MIDIIGSLRAWLASQSEITDLLDTVGVAPAVYNGFVPQSIEINAPVVVIDQPTQDSRSDTSTEYVRDVRFNLRVYARVAQSDGSRSSLTLDRAAATLCRNLHSARVTLLDFDGNASGSFMGGQVDGPVPAPAESPSLGGRRISARWLIQET